ncbi:MAG: hypothetical protein LUE64_01960 [Candidatus Gastranaerophilales bacterium]|nr:hypothetical protein [Candidatus Gastranaerophilales bacterium]
MSPISFEGSSPAKNIGRAAGVVAGVAAAGSLVYAAKTGKGDTFVKKVGNGYQTLGSKIAKKAGEATEWVKSKLPKAKEKAAEAVDDVVDDAQSAAGKLADDVQAAAPVK